MAEEISVSDKVAEIQANVSEMTKTCRQILTLASQYGFSGFVDIAVHNNDANAHKDILDDIKAKMDELTIRVAALEAKTSNL